MKAADNILFGWFHNGGGVERALKVSHLDIDRLWKEGVKYTDCSDPELKLFLIACYKLKIKELQSELKELLGRTDFDLILPGGWNHPYLIDQFHGPVTARTLINAFSTN